MRLVKAAVRTGAAFYLGSQVQHGMLSGCNIKRGQIQVEEEKKIYIYKHSLRNFLHTVGRHRLGPEHVQISTPETWPHPNTMRASGARALGGMFGNARATHTAKLCPKNTGAKTQKCWDKKSCAGSAGAKKSTLDTQVTHWHTASKRCQPAWLQTYRDWRIDRWIGGR